MRFPGAPTYRPQSLAEHWDGTSWSTVAVPDIGQLSSVAAGGPDDIWVLGGSPTMLHFDGANWTKVPTADAHDPQLRDLISFGPNDAWVVGTERTESYAGHCGEVSSGSRPLVEHWDGTMWRVVATPSPPVHESEIWSVGGSSSDDLWAVGYYQTDTPPTKAGSGCANKSFSHARTLAMHWDGSSWSISPTPNPGNEDDVLSGITSLGPNDAWTTGWWIPGQGPGWPLFLHWDGSSWKVDPGLEGTGPQRDRQPWVALALGSHDVWTAGGYPNAPSIEHWNGSAWRIFEDAHLNIDPHREYGQFNDISATAPDDVWAVGGTTLYGSGQQRAFALIMRWDGSRWTRMAPAPSPG